MGFRGFWRCLRSVVLNLKLYSQCSTSSVVSRSCFLEGLGGVCVLCFFCTHSIQEFHGGPNKIK